MLMETLFNVAVVFHGLIEVVGSLLKRNDELFVHQSERIVATPSRVGVVSFAPRRGTRLD